MRKLAPLFIVVLALALVQCAPPATPAPTDTPAEAPEETTPPEATEPPEPTDTAAPEPTPTEVEEAEQVLRIAFDASDLSSLDPHFAAATQDRGIVDMVFNGLIRYRPGDISQFEPDLATAIPEPTMEGDQQVWVFELREGVMCHPWSGNEGYELTSADVVYSLEKAANPDRSAYAGEYTGMTFEAPDDYTVRIILDQPLSPALFLPKVADYAGGFIVCSQAAEDLGDQAFSTQPVGTGPFMFDSYTPMENVTLAANEAYFRGTPNLTQVEAHYIPDISSRELGLREGELDVVEGLREQPWIENMQGVEGVTVDVFGPGETVVLHMNQTVEPLGNATVRQAIAYALAREDFLAFFGEDTADPLYSPVPAAFLAGGLTQEEVAEAGVQYETDREMAQELLAEAGAEEFSLTSNTSERASYRRTYEAIQDQLNQVGITLNLEVVDHSTMHSLIREDANPLIIYIAWRPNADVFLTRFYHSDSIVVTGENPDTNFSHYDQIDDLIEQARAETDPEVQAELWKEAQIQILEDAVAYPLFILKFVFGRAEYVDFGYDLQSTLALYPQVTENTQLTR